MKCTKAREVSFPGSATPTGLDSLDYRLDKQRNFDKRNKSETQRDLIVYAGDCARAKAKEETGTPEENYEINRPVTVTANLPRSIVILVALRRDTKIRLLTLVNTKPTDTLCIPIAQKKTFLSDTSHAALWPRMHARTYVSSNSWTASTCTRESSTHVFHKYSSGA